MYVTMAIIIAVITRTTAQTLFFIYKYFTRDTFLLEIFLINYLIALRVVSQTFLIRFERSFSKLK